MMLSGEQVSEVIDLDASSAAVFYVRQYNPATRQPLERVRPEVEHVVRSQQAEGLLAAYPTLIYPLVAAGLLYAAVFAWIVYKTAGRFHAHASR